MSENDTLVGKNISHYRILARLGKGGMGVVYRAEDTRLERSVKIRNTRSDSLRIRTAVGDLRCFAGRFALRTGLWMEGTC